MKTKILATVLVGQFLLAATAASAADNGIIIGQQPFGCKDKKQYLKLAELVQQGDLAQANQGINGAMITGDCYKFGLNEPIEILERDAQANLAKVHPKKLPKLPGKNEFFTAASSVILKK